MGRFKRRQRFGKGSGSAGAPLSKEKKSNGPMIFAIAIIALMSLSVIGFIDLRNQSSTSQSFNGIDFESADGTSWTMTIEDKEYSFAYHPLNVENINMSPEATAMLKTARAFFLVSDVNNNASEFIGKAEYDLKKLAEERGMFAEYAFTTNNTYGKMILSCANATADLPILYFSTGNETRTEYNDGCLRLQASTPYDFLRLSDRVMYTILGVMN